MLKYRILPSNEGHAYVVSVSLGGTTRTGSYTTGSAAGTISPALYAGKGFRKLDVQSSLSRALPTGYTAKLGRPVIWNTVAQYRVRKFFWPEIESNATFYRGGPRGSQIQDFVTPGLILSKFKLERDAKNRLALAFGAGEQIAVTHDHSYNHALILTTRLAF